MDLFIIISLFVGFIIGIVVHESAHAWMGNKLGDSTAKNLGRVSLNPIRHIDPIGSVILPIVGLITTQSFFGWAKPTPYNPENLRDGTKDEILIALAGPVSNLMLAGIVLILLKLLDFLGSSFGDEFLLNLAYFLYLIMLENLILAFFNLLPIPPLDGSSFLKMIVPAKFLHHLNFLHQYGFMLLMGMSFTPIGDLIGAYIDMCVGLCLKIAGYGA